MNNNLITAHWLPSGKYFIKCSNCGYEIINFNRIAAPRKCPKCYKYMYEVSDEPEDHGPLYNFLERQGKKNAIT